MSNDPPSNPRSRLIMPGKPEKPRTRLIAPAVETGKAASEPEAIPAPPEAETASPVTVAPLAPPPAAAPAEDEEPAIGEAEQGEFTVIDEDTGETHTVPVKVSSMAPPPVAVALADPDPEPDPRAAEEALAAAAEAEEAARLQAQYEAELAIYEQQMAEYEAAQRQAAYEAAQQQGAYAAQQPQPAYAPPPRAPQAGPYAPRPGAAYGGMPIVMSGGVPAWALIMIGLLIGFVGSVLAYKFTDFGKMIRPDVRKPAEQSAAPFPPRPVAMVVPGLKP